MMEAKCPRCQQKAFDEDEGWCGACGYVEDVWSTDFPTEEGLFWFYGYRWGKISVGQEQKPTLTMVSVKLNAHKQPMYIADGGFMHESEVECPHFTPVNLPEVPFIEE